MTGIDTNVLVRYLTRDDADFSDCLIDRLNRDAGCAETVTFDQKAGKLDGFHLL